MECTLNSIQVKGLTEKTLNDFDLKLEEAIHTAAILGKFVDVAGYKSMLY